MMKFHPRLQSTVIVTTVEGRVQILDIKKELSQSISFQVSLTPSSGVEVKGLLLIEVRIRSKPILI